MKLLAGGKGGHGPLLLFGVFIKIIFDQVLQRDVLVEEVLSDQGGFVEDLSSIGVLFTHEAIEVLQSPLLGGDFSHRGVDSLWIQARFLGFFLSNSKRLCL